MTSPSPLTLEAIHEFGDGGAGVLRVGPEQQGWYAGAQPLNGQAVQDLLADGWLRLTAARSVSMPALASLAERR